LVHKSENFLQTSTDFADQIDNEKAAGQRHQEKQRGLAEFAFYAGLA